MEMCRPRVGVANPLFSLWRVLRRPTAPASRTKSRWMAEESRTSGLCMQINLLSSALLISN